MLPQGRARVMTALCKHWHLGMVLAVEPVRSREAMGQIRPTRYFHDFLFFLIFFQFKNSRKLGKLLKYIEIGLKLKKYEINLFRILFSRSL
jgi:hypothetical protein